MKLKFVSLSIYCALLMATYQFILAFDSESSENATEGLLLEYGTAQNPFKRLKLSNRVAKILGISDERKSCPVCHARYTLHEIVVMPVGNSRMLHLSCMLQSIIDNALRYNCHSQLSQFMFGPWCMHYVVRLHIKRSHFRSAHTREAAETLAKCFWKFTLEALQTIGSDFVEEDAAHHNLAILFNLRQYNTNNVTLISSDYEPDLIDALLRTNDLYLAINVTLYFRFFYENTFFIILNYVYESKAVYERFKMKVILGTIFCSLWIDMKSLVDRYKMYLIL